MATSDDGTGGTGMAEQGAAKLLGIEVREGYAEVGDQRLHYVEAGRLQIKPLAEAGFRVVAPDMRGYNLSSKPDEVPRPTTRSI